MNLIAVPKPKSTMSQNRPMNTLLRAQVEHLQHVERRIPLKYRSKIYTQAIKTEGEEAAYIRHMTEAIHQAHLDAAKKRKVRHKPDASGSFIVAATAIPKRHKGSKRRAPKKKAPKARE